MVLVVPQGVQARLLRSIERAHDRPAIGGRASWIFAVAAVVTLVCTPVALRLAKRLDCPRRAGCREVPQEHPFRTSVGSAMVISFVLVAVVAGRWSKDSDQQYVPDLAVFLALAVGLAVLGLVDDLRGLSPWPRLALEIGAGIGVWTTTNTSWLPGPRPLQAVATVCWVVIVTNSFNLLDNMDGLAAGMAAVSSIFLFAVALENGQFVLGTFALGLAGCAVGFLRYNFHPARIYMGDSGSLFLGFVLAVLSLDIRFPNFTPATFVVPILIVGVAAVRHDARFDREGASWTHPPSGRARPRQPPSGLRRTVGSRYRVRPVRRRRRAGLDRPG